MTPARADLLILLAALIWGVAYVFQKAAMSHIGPLSFVAARSVIATLCLLPLAMRESAAPGLWRATAIGGGVFFLAACVQQIGIVTASATNAAFLTALYVVAAVGLAWLVFRRRPGPRLWLAAALSLAGAWALAGGQVGQLGFGELLIVISALFWGGYSIATEYAGRINRPFRYTAGVFAIVAALTVPLALTWENHDPAAWRAAAPLVLYVGVLSSAVTFGLMSVALAHIQGPRASIILSSEAVFAALAAFAILGERLPPLAWAGAAMIVAAVILVQSRTAA